MRTRTCLSLFRASAFRKSLVRSCSGQSLVEFALIFPVAFLLIVNVVNFGGLFYCYVAVDNAARAGASYMIMGASSANAPQLPTVSQVQDLVHADLGSALARGSGATVTPCGIQKDGTVKWITNYNPVTLTACTMPTNPLSGTTYTDPQASSEMFATVKVDYRFCPIIPGWNFPALGVYSTLPSCTGSGNTLAGGTLITRVASMRVLQ